MEIIEIEKARMDSLKALSETNMKVSESRVALAQLQEQVDAFILDREEKALNKISEMLEQSKATLQETHDNYDAVHSLARTASEFAAYLTESFAKLTAIRTTFDEKTALWGKEVEKTTEKYAEIQKLLKIDRDILKNDREGLEKEKRKLEIERIKLKDEWGTLERAIARLKQNKI